MLLLSGLILTKGVGEIPILQMATFSIWTDTTSMESFSRLSSGHGAASRSAMDGSWFREYLFSRFQPYRGVGRWGSIDFASYVVLGLEYEYDF